MTRLTIIANRVMEIGWVASLVVTPLFFNVFSSRIFEPDKITLLRSIALVVLVGWIVKVAETTNQQKGRVELSEVIRTPLFIPVLLLIFNYLISTVFSIAPFVSLWGSYQRLQGTFTTYSYLVLFFSFVFNRPSAKQIRRIVTMMIAVSLPVAVYGLLQRYKIDPIPWGGDVSVRIASTLGNSIFVAAYLILVFPLTLGRVLESFGRMLGSDAFELKDFLLSTAYVFIALLQIIALYFSGSRGPALGWLASLFFFSLGWAYVRGKRNVGLAILALSVLVLIFLVVFNLPQSPFESLKTHPSIGRFGQLLDPQSNNARVRSYIWQGAVKLYGFHPPLEYPDGHKDAFNWLRPIIGYGPETMYVAYNRFYVPELTQVEKRNASPDRSHNETWDALIVTGGIGFCVYIALFLSLFSYGYQKLDLIQTDREKWIFWGGSLFLGVLCSLLLIFWRGVAYFGIAFPLGMIAAFFGYLSMKILFFRANRSEHSIDFGEAILVISILSAIVAHLVEINFGIAIAATRTYFWFLAAILVVLVTKDQPEGIPLEEVSEQSKAEGGKRKKRAGISKIKSLPQQGRENFALDGELAIFVALILVVLGYNFMNATELGRSPLMILWKSFTEVQKEGTFNSNGILLVLSLAWMISSLLLWGEEVAHSGRQASLRSWASILGLSLGFALLYWVIHANLLASIVASQINNVQDILTRIRQYEGLLVGFYLFLFALMVCYALITPQRNGGSVLRIGYRKSWLVGLICLIVCIPVIYERNLRVIQADVAYKLAESFSKPGSWQVAIQIYQHAIELAPREDYYYLFLGRAYLERAGEINEGSQREALFSQAKSDLLLARSLNPLNTDHTANLARLYSQWSLNTQDETQREERFRESERYFTQAVSLSPNNSRLWGEWAVLLMSNEKTRDQALPKLMKAYQLDPTYDWISYLFGEYYRLQASRIREEGERSRMIEMAISNYQKAATLTEENNSKKTYYLMAAQLAIEGGMISQAISALENVLSVSPTDGDRWKYEQSLAQLYFQSAQMEQALLHAQNALNLAPPEQQAEVENLIEQITQSSR